MTSYDNEENKHPGRLRIVLGRAALVYLGLFLGLSLVMSILGINPLIHNGAVPKCLLVYVGLALILALANPETHLLNDQARCRLLLFSRRPFKEH